MADSKIMSISVEGIYLVACSPSGVELARVPVKGEGTGDHIASGVMLIHAAFEFLNAEGFPRARTNFPWLPESVEIQPKGDLL